jgi:long-chain acyl-CoA synthetase
VLIVGKLDDCAAQKSGVPGGLQMVSLGFFGGDDGDKWEDLIQKNEPIVEVASRTAEDLITIIYTSGTTGLPKGVMHSWSAMNEISQTLLQVVKTPKQPRFFSYLPLSHVAERIGINFQAMYRGATVSFPETLDTFPDDLSACQPHIFFAVPRVWAKFQEKIWVKMPEKKLNLFLKIPILKNIVKKKILTALGLAEVRFVVTGAAPISKDMLEWYQKLGVTIHNCYGMTEDGLMSHFNRPDANRFGSVGKPLGKAVAKLDKVNESDKEGEILVKSPCLMKGYYKDEEKTKASFTEDGYLRTGDLGEYDQDGFLYIVGRAKDQFKTDKGKYIAPAPIELKLSENPVIEQLCIVGFGIPQPIALITLSEEGKSLSKEALSKSLSKSIKDLNPTLATYEKIKKAVVLKEEWTVENSILTPTMKLKRNVVEKKHMPNYKSWYDLADEVVYT